MSFVYRLSRRQLLPFGHEVSQQHYLDQLRERIQRQTKRNLRRAAHPQRRALYPRPGPLLSGRVDSCGLTRPGGWLSQVLATWENSEGAPSQLLLLGWSVSLWVKGTL